MSSGLRPIPLTWLPLIALLGCSTVDGAGAGDTTGPPPPAEPLPAPDGGACGDGAFGWETECEVLGQIAYEDPLAPGKFLELDPFVGPTTACCEGSPSLADADGACEQACIRRLCRIAENIYESIADENGWHCVVGCKFDFDGCVAGIPVQQFPQPPLGDDYPHEVTASCSATNVEPRQADGSFAFIGKPTNHTFDDPAVCGEPPEESGLEPLRVLAANGAHEDSGTIAVATWRTTHDGGQLGSTEVSARMEYDLRPCRGMDCLELMRFEASIPGGDHEGMSVQSADLMLIAVTDSPVVDRAGRFVFPPGSLHFVLRADVSELPVSITRSNATPVLGRVSQASDLIELTDLHLRFEDTGLGAELRLDFVGAHDNRAPVATIRRLETPPSCDEPVVLMAGSVDLDGDPMQHYWWTPNGMMKASSTELVLPRGEHLIVLLSVDSHGAHDVTSLYERRRCT